ncbi:MAG: tRNA (N(6)-L-threonylcarbamoyladenosine(37)-C(2))-methylthiotransferase MtaB [Agathobaculum sp.]|jgi:threonylcarbamoyladenosine tRNA methylthiotransferase MtaB|uniref:tRNA (N(6)-L-threonylcarbamoyladenosine(37)-C(2))- methylthiotransferase MtaB n=1 Tax=Agathobaculum sp. TaxID=2048138 RepID=UPI003D8E7293
MRFAFFTLGCKVNLFETQALSQLAEARGHELVDRDADAVVINTCTVTSVSDHKNIRAFHKLRKDNPNAVIAACGCFAQIDPAQVRQNTEIDLVCGTKERARVIEMCEAAVNGRSIPAIQVSEQDSNNFELLPAGIPKGRTRALLKIEDGCNNFCTYCIIPYARGRVRSLSPVLAEQETARLEAAGAREIVLTGIEIASYGKDLQPRSSLTELLVQLLAAHPQVRFRLGSLDPRIVDEDFCERLCCYDNLALHFHLSLQSGSDTVLQRMGRKYSAEQYYRRVDLLQNAFPDCSVTTDLIVGFPGETEEEFLQSVSFLRRCGFAAVHVFPFSPREGTRAANMEHPIAANEKARRAQIAKKEADALSAQYRKRFIGRILNVLPEHCAHGLRPAHGRYGFPVYIKEAEAQRNIPIDVRITDLYRDGVLAEIL